MTQTPSHYCDDESVEQILHREEAAYDERQSPKRIDLPYDEQELPAIEVFRPYSREDTTAPRVRKRPVYVRRDQMPSAEARLLEFARRAPSIAVMGVSATMLISCVTLIVLGKLLSVPLISPAIAFVTLLSSSVFYLMARLERNSQATSASARIAKDSFLHSSIRR